MEPTTPLTPLDDTIVAIATPPGSGGIAVLRLSGPAAPHIVQRLWQGTPIATLASHTAHLGTLTDHGEPLDEAVLTLYRAPRSYTGQDVVELSVHGSPYIQQRLLQLLIDEGARLAGPGEFTRRAFAHGRLDLARAEAVADIIAARSRAAHRLAMTQLDGRFSAHFDALRRRLIDLASLLELELDFGDEDVLFASRADLRTAARDILQRVQTLHSTFRAGNAIAHGIPVALVGPVNAGKSSLLNHLAGYPRAIVTDIPGTTRDTVEEHITLGDHTLRLIDTAGLRPHTDDPVEALGQQRSTAAACAAAILLVVHDTTRPDLDIPLPDDTHATILHLWNKSDLAPAPAGATLTLSATTGSGMDTLRRALVEAADTLTGDASADTIVTNLRHAEALADAAAALQRLLDGLAAGHDTVLLAHDLRRAIHALATITGTITDNDILANIFSRFCIGK